MNKNELDKYCKELKAEIRELRNKTIKEEEVKGDLPETGTVFYRNEKREMILVDVKFDPESKQIMIVNEKNVGKDLALAIGKIKKGFGEKVAKILKEKK